nr:MAG TPA: hypothetical protein [Inoviridae sp.]
MPPNYININQIKYYQIYLSFKLIDRMSELSNEVTNKNILFHNNFCCFVVNFIV